jgi:hypothetical protein
MKEFWQRAQQIWNKCEVLAWILVMLGTALAVCSWIFPQPPGVSIGLLAAAAGIMSVRPPKMHPAERFAWVGILIALAVLEVWAIGRNDKAAETIRDSQNQAFQRIVDGLKESIATSKNEYDSTIGHLNGVLKTTKEVAALAKKNLENTTGGRFVCLCISGQRHL